VGHLSKDTIFPSVSFSLPREHTRHATGSGMEVRVDPRIRLIQPDLQNLVPSSKGWEKDL
jgi:hypothetical protein